jgi:hypothetical protein
MMKKLKISYLYKLSDISISFSQSLSLLNLIILFAVINMFFIFIHKVNSYVYVQNVLIMLNFILFGTPVPNINIVNSYEINLDKTEPIIVTSYTFNCKISELFIVTSYTFNCNLFELLIVISYKVYNSSKVNIIVTSYVLHKLNNIYYQMDAAVTEHHRDRRPRGTPPPPPTSLGSLLYPRNAEPLNDSEPYERQLARISLDRQLNERNSFIEMKGTEYREFRNRHQGHRYWETCSEACTSTRNYMLPVFHKHGSSKMYRAMAPTDDWGAFLCLSCEISPHRVKVGIRTPILISSSTLHDWQGRRYENNYTGDKLHMDTLTIPGGRINALQHALQAEYGKTYRPLDVLAVFGLNDLLQGKSVNQIVKEMEEFQAAVHQLAPEGEKNSVAIATILLPPKLSDFGEGHSGNRIEDIVDLNFHIMRLNSQQHQDSLPTKYAPRFHSWGLKTRKPRRRTGPRSLMENLTGHRHNQWRERLSVDMLHLNDATRLRMGRSCVTYFMALYGMVDTNSPRKPVSVQREKDRRVKRKHSYKSYRPANSQSSAQHRSQGYRTHGFRDGRGARRMPRAAQDQAHSTRPSAPPKRYHSRYNASPDQGAGPQKGTAADTKSNNPPTSLAEQREVCQRMVILLDKLKK